MFFDLALSYDPALRCCDLVIGDDGDLLIDETPLPAMLTSAGLDRRAAPDDQLPEGRSQFLAPASFSERRGSPGDGIDPFGEFSGSKLWLLDRAKQTEETRLLAAYWLDEAFAWTRRETGQPARITVEWSAPGRLSWRAVVADTSLSLSRRVGD